jgi:hypothetical protein
MSEPRYEKAADNLIFKTGRPLRYHVSAAACHCDLPRE